MRATLRRAMPLLSAAVVLVSVGCGSKATDHPSLAGPSAPQPVASSDGPVRALAVAPPLGTAAGFGLVAASTATNTGVSTLITGDLGVSPGNTAPGFLGANVTGTIHLADGPASTAQADAITAYGVLVGQPCDIDLTGQNLGGKTLTPGVYCFSSSAQLTGTLTLNGLGFPGAAFVFKIGSTLTTASGSRVVFTNSAQPCGTFWQVGASATLGTTTDFGGNLLALASITLNTGAGNNGGVYAQTGAVTVDSGTATAVGSCGSVDQPPPPSAVPALPPVAALGLFALLLVTGFVVVGRR